MSEKQPLLNEVLVVEANLLDLQNPRAATKDTLRLELRDTQAATPKFYLPGDESRVKPKVALGMITLLGLLYTNVIGSAFGSEDAVGAGGSALTIVCIFLLPLIQGFPLALSVTELACSIPTNAGFLMWFNCAFHPVIYFTNVLLTCLYIVVDTALYPSIFSEYTCQLFECSDWGKKGLKISLLFGCGFMNAIGIEIVGIFSVIITLLSLLPFYITFFWQLAKGGFDWNRIFTFKSEVNWTVFLPTISWNISGLEQVGAVAEEIVNPQKTVIRVMVPLMAMVWLTFIPPVISSVSAQRDTDWTVWKTGYYATAAELIAGPAGKYMMVVGGIASSLGLTMSNICCTSRTVAGMGKAGAFPAPISRVLSYYHPKFKTPIVAVSIITFVTSLVAAFFDFHKLVGLDQVAYSIRVLMIFAALIRMRIMYPNLDRPFKIPLSTIPLCVAITPAFCYCIALTIISLSVDPFTVYLGIGVILFFIVVALIYVQCLRTTGFAGGIIHAVDEKKEDEEDSSTSLRTSQPLPMTSTTRTATMEAQSVDEGSVDGEVRPREAGDEGVGEQRNQPPGPVASGDVRKAEEKEAAAAAAARKAEEEEEAAAAAARKAEGEEAAAAAAARKAEEEEEAAAAAAREAEEEEAAAAAARKAEEEEAAAASRTESNGNREESVPIAPRYSGALKLAVDDDFNSPVRRSTTVPPSSDLPQNTSASPLPSSAPVAKVCEQGPRVDSVSSDDEGSGPPDLDVTLRDSRRGDGPSQQDSAPGILNDSQHPGEELKDHGSHLNFGSNNSSTPSVHQNPHALENLEVMQLGVSGSKVGSSSGNPLLLSEGSFTSDDLSGSFHGHPSDDGRQAADHGAHYPSGLSRRLIGVGATAPPSSHYRSPTTMSLDVNQRPKRRMSTISNSSSRMTTTPEHSTCVSPPLSEPRARRGSTASNSALARLSAPRLSSGRRSSFQSQGHLNMHVDEEEYAGGLPYQAAPDWETDLRGSKPPPPKKQSTKVLHRKVSTSSPQPELHPKRHASVLSNSSLLSDDSRDRTPDVFARLTSGHSRSPGGASPQPEDLAVTKRKSSIAHSSTSHLLQPTLSSLGKVSRISPSVEAKSKSPSTTPLPKK